MKCTYPGALVHKEKDLYIRTPWLINFITTTMDFVFLGFPRSAAPQTSYKRWDVILV
jgi:hypothetical protein